MVAFSLGFFVVDVVVVVVEEDDDEDEYVDDVDDWGEDKGVFEVFKDGFISLVATCEVVFIDGGTCGAGL